jgi:hypothetical protein
MKTLKLMLAGIAIIFTSLAANANVKSHKAPLSQDDVVNMYVSAINTGSANNLDKILNSDIKFNSMRGENVHTLNKDELVNYVKSTSGNTVQADVTKTVLASDDNSAKIQVDFKYDGYTRTDIVTLDKANGWEITAVDSSTK